MSETYVPEAAKTWTPETEEPKETLDYFTILNESLRGKTEAELTPEQREAEAEFGQKNLEKFLDLIDKDQVYLHETVPWRNNLDTILHDGLLSQHQNQIEKYKGNKGFPYKENQWQSSSESRLNHLVLEPFVVLYSKLRSGNITNEEFEEQKNNIVATVPTLGRKRVSYFLEKVIQPLVDKNEEPIPFSRFEDMEHFSKEKNPLAFLNKSDMRSSLANLAGIIGGEDLISSSPASVLKHLYHDRKKHTQDPFSGSGIDGNGIYFDRPNELRLYDLTPQDRAISSDIGISAKIKPIHFRALTLGNYNIDDRTLFVLDTFSSKEELGHLAQMQQSGLLLFDDSLTPIPPIHSIRVQLTHTGSEKDSTKQWADDNYWDQRKKYSSFIESFAKKNTGDSHTKIRQIGKEKGYQWALDPEDGSTPDTELL